MKSVLSFFLLLAAYGWLSGAVAMALFLLVVHPDWPGSEYTKGAGYIMLMILGGASAFWLGRRLWRRWRTAFGLIGLILGLAGIAESLRMNASISPSLITSQILGILVATGLLVAPKFSAHK